MKYKRFFIRVCFNKICNFNKLKNKKQLKSKTFFNLRFFVFQTNSNPDALKQIFIDHLSLLLLIISITLKTKVKQNKNYPFSFLKM